MSGMVEIDGSMLEGGGQILRTSVALSALTGKPVKIFNVRARRNPPGLRYQHLTAIKTVGALTEAEVEGLEVGSTEVKFNPKTIKSGSFSFNVGTAGSITLILQALAPVAAYAPGEVKVEITGGTNTKWSPPVEYVIDRVYRFIYSLMDYNVDEAPFSIKDIVDRFNQYHPPWVLEKGEAQQLTTGRLKHALKILSEIGLVKYRSDENKVIIKKVKKISGDMLDYLLEKIVKHRLKIKKKPKGQMRITNFI